MNEEIWKRIPGFEMYEVSDHGRVRSYYKRVGKKVVISDNPQRILTQSTDRYPGVHLCLKGKMHYKRVGCLVLSIFVGPRPDGLVMCHSDDNPQNNHLNNLRWDTHKNNILDKAKNGGYKLSEQEIIQIRNRRASREQIASIAEDYNVGPSTISNICKGHVYKWVGGPRTHIKPGYFVKLTKKDVRAIKQAIANGEKYKDIAPRFGISTGMVGHINTGYSWSEIEI